ncbi:transporter substrate-binding domain-containing protein [Neptunomonas antarctica]|uniref:diguanylate cyclase n=1 Tax=Neptunomonas antarctica TaxID=619304 RepID=A0A1N7J527_9GAMM|nr:transporter substrate-binding domain-containing protein [Neptunomonas antarctica]SIS44409.1 periplasmic/7TM domain sensor diguanylate cyclase [Neptunomonas antarctica]
MDQRLFAYKLSKVLFLWLGLTCSAFVFSEYSSPNPHSVILSAQEKIFLQNHPEITLGTDASWEPFVIVNPNGHISGYDADILRKINQLTGANFTLTAGQWTDMQVSAQSREIDGLSTGTAVQKRRSYLNFSVPYLTLQKSVFTSSGNPLLIQSPADLRHKTLVIQKGNLADIELAKQFKESRILYVDTVEELFSAISTGAADATFGNGATLYLANKLGMPYLHIAFHLPQKLNLVFGVRKEWPEAVSILNKGLAALKAHERIRIQTQWFSQQPLVDNKPKDDVINFSEDEKSIIHQQPTLKMCVGPQWLPFSSINKEGKYEGISADLVDVIRQRLDVNFSLIPTSHWNESIALIKDKKCDIITTINPTDARKEFLNFTQTLFTSPIVLATRLDQFFISDLSKITDQSIAIIKNSAAALLVNNKYPQINLIEVLSVQEGLKLLSEKKVFGYIDSLEVIAYNVKKSNYVNLKISSTLPIEFDIAIGIRKDWPEWIPLMNKAIQSISSEQHQKIQNSWIGITYDNPFNYTWLGSILAVITSCVFVLVYRNREVTKYNRKLEVLNQKLAKQATTDQLTGLPNRYLLDQEIQIVIASAKRYNEPVSMALFDLDFFKNINDQYGHQTGDEILIQVSHEMDTFTRNSDVLGRWGGEEFLLVCPKTTLDGACNLANKVRLHIQQQLFLSDIKITLSAGVAELREDEDYGSLLKRLDELLYSAKDTGRNKVTRSKD